MDFPRGQRLDPAWRDPALYARTEVVRPRFQDLDPLGHINNVAMAALFETARVEFNHAMAEHFKADGLRTLVAGQTLNYVAEAHHRPDVTFHLGVGHLGRTSWGLQALAVQGGTPVLLAVATMVSTRGGAPCAVPDGLRAALQARRMRAPAGAAA